MEELLKAFEIIEKIYDDFAQIGTIETVGAIFGTILDQWCADKDVSTDRARKMLEHLVLAHKYVDDSLGRMKKSNVENPNYETAINLIDEFCKSEYGNDAKIDDLTNIPLAYTTLGDNDETEVQVSVNLIKNEIVTTFSGAVEAEFKRSYPSTEKLIQNELNYLDFGNLVYFYDID